MKHTALILSSCSWSCCTFRKFIIRWLYPQCFPCSTLYNQQSIFFLVFKKKKRLQRKKWGRKHKQELLKMCLIVSSHCKEKKSDVISAHTSKLLLIHCPFQSQHFPLCHISFLFTAFILPVIFSFSLSVMHPLSCKRQPHLTIQK